MDSTMQDFIALVHEMRAAQKEYFRTRNTSILSKSKAIEKQVDKMLVKLANLETRLANKDLSVKQLDLFSMGLNNEQGQD